MNSETKAVLTMLVRGTTPKPADFFDLCYADLLELRDKYEDKLYIRHGIQERNATTQDHDCKLYLMVCKEIFDRTIYTNGREFRFFED